MKINVLSAIVLLLVVSSCSTSKTAYFENLDIEEMSGKMDVGNYELRIAPDDMLSITVSSVVHHSRKVLTYSFLIYYFLSAFDKKEY